MTQFNIPTARWESFTDSKQACDYIRHADYPALVVKASGLAAGKGVIVAKDKEEACQAAVDILQVSCQTMLLLWPEDSKYSNGVAQVA